MSNSSQSRTIYGPPC